MLLYIILLCFSSFVCEILTLYLYIDSQSRGAFIDEQLARRIIKYLCKTI